MLGNVGPGFREFLVELDPHCRFRMAVGHDRLDWTFGLTNPAVDTIALPDDKHSLTFVEAIYRADGNAIHILASYAAIGHNEWHAATLWTLTELVHAAAGPARAATRWHRIRRTGRIRTTSILRRYPILSWRGLSSSPGRPFIAPCQGPIAKHEVAWETNCLFLC